MIDWVTLEAAIQSWVASATGYDADTAVIWAEQNSPRPAGAYIELSATATLVGHDWQAYDDAGSPSPGAELTETVRGTRDLALRVRAYGGGAKGVAAPAAVVDGLIASARLGANQELLTAAGWNPARFTPALKIGGLIGGTFFEPRAEITVYGYTSSELTGTATYIEFVEVTNTIPDPDYVATFDLINGEIS